MVFVDITVITFIIIIVELYNSSFKGKLHDIEVKPQMLALQYTLKLETKPSKKIWELWRVTSYETVIWIVAQSQAPVFV